MEEVGGCVPKSDWLPTAVLGTCETADPNREPVGDGRSFEAAPNKGVFVVALCPKRLEDAGGLVTDCWLPKREATVSVGLAVAAGVPKIGAGEVASGAEGFKPKSEPEGLACSPKRDEATFGVPLDDRLPKSDV